MISDKQKSPPAKSTSTSNNRYPEAFWSVVFFMVACVGVLVTCQLMGDKENRDPMQTTIILGFPDWIFWGIVVPWISCTIVTIFFAFWVIPDDHGMDDQAND